MFFGSKKAAPEARPVAPTIAKDVPEKKAWPATAPVKRAEPPACSASASVADDSKVGLSLIGSAQTSVALTKIISILLRSPQHKPMPLADLEWLVIPALAAGQFAFAEAKPTEKATHVPLAVALWAMVSAEIDQRLRQNLDAPIKLKPEEWKSGDVPWLIEAVGDARVVSGLLKHVAERSLRGRAMTLRVRGPAGKFEIKHLQAADSAKH